MPQEPVCIDMSNSYTMDDSVEKLTILSFPQKRESRFKNVKYLKTTESRFRGMIKQEDIFKY